MSTRERIRQLEQRLKGRPGIVQWIIYVRPGEPEPEDVPAGCLLVTTRIVTKGGTNEYPSNRPAA